MCVGDVFLRSPLPESLLCATLLYCSLCCGCSSSASLSGLSCLEATLPLQRADGGGSSPLLKLTPSPAFKAAPTRVMQGHQTASSLSAWLLLSLSVSASLPFPFPLYLPPSLLFLSLSQYSTDTAPPPASLISRIRYSFKKTHSTWLRAQTTLTQRGKEGEGATDGG